MLAGPGGAGVPGRTIEAMALDTTGSSVVPVDENLQPLDDYYLWCDHRAWREAAESPPRRHETGLEAIEWCGGVYSSEWGFSKLLHWLRHNPDKRARMATALGTLRHGGRHALRHHRPRRRRCPQRLRDGPQVDVERVLGGLPPEEFLVRRRSAARRRARKLQGRYATGEPASPAGSRRNGPRSSGA
jgi:L-ribulokinase